MPDLGWTKHISDVEEINYRVCVETAKRNGYTKEEALECSHGELKCHGCPWRKGDNQRTHSTEVRKRR